MSYGRHSPIVADVASAFAVLGVITDHIQGAIAVASGVVALVWYGINIVESATWAKLMARLRERR